MDDKVNGFDRRGPAGSVEGFFGAHARDYAASPRHARGGDLARLLDAIRTAPGQKALDVATGPGHVAFQLAERGLSVVGLDVTPAMLAVAQESAEHRPDLVGRLQWVLADAARVPLADASVDVVTCRRAAHHFPSIPAALREWARVLRPGGVVGISDLTAPRGQLDALNAVERLRDPSHQAALSADEWVDALVAAGFRLRWSEVTVEPMTALEWLSPVRPESGEGRAALDAIAAWDAGTAHALHDDGVFMKYRILLVGERR
jgi:ubiquinone/menaquinone biosynthesis C-methylase UbiE